VLEVHPQPVLVQGDGLVDPAEQTVFHALFGMIVTGGVIGCRCPR
jgi:hypothetical protein